LNGRKDKDGKVLKSAIVNLSSVAALWPVPGTSLYAGTKAFNHQFSESLAEEYWDQIDILSVLPHYVRTPMTSTLGTGDRWFAINPEECVKASMRSLGKSTSTIGHWKHALRALWQTLLPRWCQRKAVFEFYCGVAKATKDAEAKKANEPKTA